MRWGRFMPEVVNLSPMPTTLVTAGLTLIIAASGSGVRGDTPPRESKKSTTDATRPQEYPPFSNFRYNYWFKELPQEFAEPYREMLAFKSFKEGWDGAESMEVANESVNAVLAFLALLPSDMPSPEASAASDGTVDWYWRKGSRAATVTFYKNRKAAYFSITDDGSVKGAFDLVDKIPGELVESLRQL
jgi:hypothetical protein